MMLSKVFTLTLTLISLSTQLSLCSVFPPCNTTEDLARLFVNLETNGDETEFELVVDDDTDNIIMTRGGGTIVNNIYNESRCLDEPAPVCYDLTMYIGNGAGMGYFNMFINNFPLSIGDQDTPVTSDGSWNQITLSFCTSSLLLGDAALAAATEGVDYSNLTFYVGDARTSIQVLDESQAYIYKNEYVANSELGNSVSLFIKADVGCFYVYMTTDSDSNVYVNGQEVFNLYSIQGEYAFAYTTCRGLVITGVIDGPLPGGQPKAIELYTLSDVDNLCDYSLGSANNGGGSDGQEFNFCDDSGASSSAKKGDFLYVVDDIQDFVAFFGNDSERIIYDGAPATSINGDDAIELFYDGQVVDIYGVIDKSGDGEAWDYYDGWAYRYDGTGPDGSSFVESNWYYSGADALDGESNNNDAQGPFPIGTYEETVTPSPKSSNSSSTDTGGPSGSSVGERKVPVGLVSILGLVATTSMAGLLF